MILDLFIQFMVAGIATFAFSVIFNAPFKETPYGGFTGAIGWLVYYALHDCLQFNIMASALIATAILTVIARIFAVRRQNPATIYLLPGTFPLVPGAGIYFTAYYLISNNREMFAAKGTETVELAIAIVFGIIFGTAIPQIVFNKLFGRKQLPNT